MFSEQLMSIARFFNTPRAALVTGMMCGVAFIVTLAPSPSPDAPPLNKSYRPNISSLELPKKLDFCGEAVPMDNPEVRKRMDREFLLNLQSDGQIMLYLKRSGEFFPLYDSLLKEAGMPSDLKYLSVAESALFQAQSGKGAVGLWQFIPETARGYGLRVDESVDERRDPVKATKAAIRYLKDLHDKFGSWALAAASYNMGEGATTDDLSFQNGRTYFDLYLNEETSRYLFRIVAIKEIMSNAPRYGFFLDEDDYYRPTPARTVMVDSEVPNMARWAETQGATYKEVKLLNPWILKRALPRPSGGQYAIAVPAR